MISGDIDREFGKIYVTQWEINGLKQTNIQNWHNPNVAILDSAILINSVSVNFIKLFFINMYYRKVIKSAVCHWGTIWHFNPTFSWKTSSRNIAAGAIKIILIMWIISKNRERFPVDRFSINKIISMNSSFPVTNFGSSSSSEFSA